MDPEEAWPESEKDELNSLIETYQSLALQDLSKGDPGGALLSQESIAQYVGRLHGEESEQYLNELQTLARYQVGAGAYGDAVDTLTRILEQEETFIPEPAVADDEDEDDSMPLSFESVRSDLADAQRNMESYEEAEINYRRVLEKQDLTKPGHLMGVLSAKQGLALALAQVGNDDEAVKLVNETVDLVVTHLPGDSYLLRTARDVLAEVYYIQGDFQKMLETHQRTYDSLAMSDGEDTIWTDLAKNSLAQAWVLNGREEEARKILEWPAILVTPSRTGDEPKRIAALWFKALSTPNSDGTGYGDIRQLDDLLYKVENRNTSPWVGLSGAEGRSLLRDYLRVGQNQGKVADCAYRLESATREIANRLGENHIGTAQLLELNARAVLYTGGDFEGSIELLKRVRDIYTEKSGAESHRSKRCDSLLKLLVDDEGELDENKVINLLESDWQKKVQDQGATSHAAYTANVTLVKALSHFDRDEEAVEQLRKSSLRPVSDTNMAQRALDAAQLFQAFRLEEEALKLYLEALEVLELEDGLLSTEVFMTISRIGRLEGVMTWDKVVELCKRTIDRAAIFLGPKSIFVEESVQAWKVANILHGMEDEESAKIPNDYIKESGDRWKEARKANLTSLKPLLEGFNI